jgi:ribonuclease P protein component
MSSSGGGRKAGRGLPCDRKLRRNERITEQLEFKQVIGKGSIALTRQFKAYVLVDGGERRRVGFIAGKGVGNACRRNRAKRLLREAYRQLKPVMRPDGFRVVLVARRGIAECELREVEAELKGMLRNCQLLLTE